MYHITPSRKNLINNLLSPKSWIEDSPDSHQLKLFSSQPNNQGYPEAKNRLYRMRPDAFPHQKIVKWFAEELGCNLYSANQEIHRSRIDRMIKELDLSEESLLEELPAAEEK